MNQSKNKTKDVCKRLIHTSYPCENRTHVAGIKILCTSHCTKGQCYHSDNSKYLLEYHTAFSISCLPFFLPER